MRGRKPAAVVTASARRLEKVPPAPRWMSKHAKAEWKRVIPLMIERRILTDADLGSVESYCIATGQVAEMEDLIRREGAVVATDRGPKKHPALQVQKDAMTQARLLAAELGLTPVSRSRAAMRDDTDDDEDLAVLGL